MAVKTNYEKNGKKYFRVTTSIGRNSSGKLIRKEFYGSSKKEAEAKRDKYLLDLKSGLNMDYQNAVLGELMHSWLFEVVRVSQNIKPSTFQRYEGIYRNYVRDTDLYSLKISNLKSIQLQRHYNDLYTSGKSSNVIKNLNKLLKTFLNYAIKEGYLLRNPCDGITIPGKIEAEKRKVEIFNDAEIEILKQGLKNHKLEALILLALGTGLRQGELLGLMWSDIDTKNRILHVERTIKEVNIIDANGNREYKTIIQTPKTKKSTRAVPFPENLLPILEKHKNSQKLDKLKYGELYIKSDFVFTTETGKNIIARNMTKSYKRLLKKLKIPYKKFHSLRHTYATKLFEREVPIKTVQELLGHSDISTTSNIYTHVMPEQKIKAIDKINDLFA
ncbi:tyrosine-type recombinase/integrase [Clostridium tetani]|uniref:Site-specific integrase n=1 Tax=Clostridium tetani TaxID=1513 RepID=A0ABY0EUJ6_CLOTA|nr:site-specific integrase [Clostridium tetani]RXI58087.1 site-specific integrase [Clostridium tetani]RXI66004.1 site-specific integrase [Clostridium tetani]